MANLERVFVAPAPPRSRRVPAASGVDEEAGPDAVASEADTLRGLSKEQDVTELDHEAALVDRLVTLLRTSTEVPIGSHEIQPGDARIKAAVSEVVAPMIEELVPDMMTFHPDGDLLARFGPPGDDGLMIQTYIVSQHGNDMDDPLAGRLEEGVAFGVPGPVLVGQGANQNKGPLASALGALAMRPASLRRPVLLAVNTEGRSSHGGSRRVIDDLGAVASRAVLAFGTDLNVSIGNRGRVDIHIEVPGASSHSSQPTLGVNPLPRAAEVIAALAVTPLPEPHPDLGPATVTPYQLRFEPVAPHTIPERGIFLVDRRLLPGERPEDAVASVRAHLAAWLDFEVDVTQGVVMFPAEVPADDPVVAGLIAEMALIREGSEAMYSKNTFDAGYGCSRGIPTVMFGPGKRSFGSDMIAAEWVPVDDCVVAARALSGLIGRHCG